MANPPLRLLHAPSSLVESKLEYFRKCSTDALIDSLAPGSEGALRVKKDGTVMNGNHRVAVLIERGLNVDGLPRELYETKPEG